MKMISLESTPVLRISSLKSQLAVLFQWVGAVIGFILSLIAADLISPLPHFILDNIPEAGFMSDPAAMLFNGAVNAEELAAAEDLARLI